VIARVKGMRRLLEPLLLCYQREKRSARGKKLARLQLLSQQLWRQQRRPAGCPGTP
jgi:hypothetical protein